MNQKIKVINKAIEPYYLLIIMVAFFIGSFITIYKVLFSPPDLIVNVQKENINYPNSINEEYIDLYSFIQDSSKNATLKDKSLIVYNYLIKTKSQRVLDINNNTNKTLKAINIRMTSVRDLTSWAISSEFLLEQEKDKLMKNVTFQNESGIIYLKDAVDLPPKGALKIYLWGDFDPYDWNESLIVDYDGGKARVENMKTFTGIKAILAEYFFEVFFFVFVTFCLIYYLQIRKYVNKKDTSEHN